MRRAVSFAAGRPGGLSVIPIDWDTDEQYRCVGPGETRLGTTSEIDYAHSVGTC
ncbi:DUF6355 family natural product biosynthesis protein [Streptomyces sp. NPDC016626]|uniref:DUF6355 family natural product biosynthesis protein n=1 Tax=Streptomyces sp. NPDC016626 TaxID=3364968 RepID=UPI0036FEE9F4